MKSVLRTSILALLLSPLALCEASATINYATDDIIVAFSTSAAPNHTGNTYLVDFGNLSQFKAGGSLADGNLHTINLGIGNQYLADLSAAGIGNLSTATWSLQGADFATGFSNVDLSKAETTKGVGSNPYAKGSTDVANSDILNMVFSFGTAAAASTAPNSFIQNSNDNPSYGKYVFGGLSQGQAYETYSNPEGLLNQVLDLFFIQNNATGQAVRLGAFDFNTTTGLIRFSSDITDFAVPEPSSTGLLLVGLGLAAACRFRRPSGRSGGLAAATSVE